MKRSTVSAPRADRATTAKRRRIRPIAIVRGISQILFFIFLPALYISAYFGIIDLVTSLRDNSFTFSGSFMSIVPLLASGIVTLLAGRFFCGWMCAFGSITEAIYRVRSRFFPKRINIPKSVDRWLRAVKYILFAGLFLAAFVGISVAAISPWDAFGMIFTVGALPNFSLVFASLLPGLVLLLVIFVASGFIERFFCRYLCPIGAVFAVLSLRPFITIEKPRGVCGACTACTRACGMGIDLRAADTVQSPECIRCMKCVEVCPRKNVSVHSGHKSLPVIAAAVTAVLMILGLYEGLTLLSSRIAADTPDNAPIVITVTTSQPQDTTSAGLNPTSETTVPAAITDKTAASDGSAASASASTAAGTTAAASDTVLNGTYTDGTYRGTGTGFRGDTTIDVTVSGGKISSITVVSSADDAKYFNRAIGSITDAVLQSQTAAVDSVSGATYSSRGILEAIKNALSTAKA